MKPDYFGIAADLARETFARGIQKQGNYILNSRGREMTMTDETVYRSVFTDEVIRAIGALARQQNVCREQAGQAVFVTGMEAAREYIVEQLASTALVRGTVNIVRVGEIQAEFWEQTKHVGVGSAVREMAEALARAEKA